MPTAQDSAELYRRLSAVEQAQKVHDAECVIRNEDMRSWRQEVSRDVQSLKLDRAKQAGALMIMATLASALGSGGVLTLFRLLGK